MSTLLDEGDKDDMEHLRMVKELSAQTYAAGMDTVSLSFLTASVHSYQALDQTWAVITSTFLGLLKNPAVRARAQAELDVVVGSTRLPSFTDRPHMPCLEALVTEALQWVPTLPLGLPHMTTANDEYRGYLIPKDTTVLYNTWCV
jgi:cytochrome P450